MPPASPAPTRLGPPLAHHLLGESNGGSPPPDRVIEPVGFRPSRLLVLAARSSRRHRRGDSFDGAGVEVEGDGHVARVAHAHQYTHAGGRGRAGAREDIGGGGRRRGGSGGRGRFEGGNSGGAGGGSDGGGGAGQGGG
eukprot:scaffold13307_cov97-Isochrysis_galbana.AAC.7